MILSNVVIQCNTETTGFQGPRIQHSLSWWALTLSRSLLLSSSSLCSTSFYPLLLSSCLPVAERPPCSTLSFSLYIIHRSLGSSHPLFTSQGPFLFWHGNIKHISRMFLQWTISIFQELSYVETGSIYLSIYPSFFLSSFVSRGSSRGERETVFSFSKTNRNGVY